MRQVHPAAVPVTNGNGPLQDSHGLMGCGELAANNVAAPGGGILGQNVSCLNAWGSSGSNITREWLNSDRVDWNINASQRIFFRFKGDHGFQPSSTNLISPVFNTQSIQPRYEGQINHTYVLSGTMVNNFIFSILWYSSIYGPADIAKSSAAFPTYFYIGGDAGSNNGEIYPNGSALELPAVWPPHGTGPVERRLVRNQGQALSEDRVQLPQE